MKLLFVNSSLTDGGSEKAMTLVAQSLAERGHEVTMALARDRERTYPIDGRVRLVQLVYRSSNKVHIAFSRLRQVRRLIAEGGFDYVICYMQDLNLITLLASLGLRTPVVVSERAYPGASTRSRFSKSIEAVLYRRAYRIVYQTRDAQRFCPPSLIGRSVVIPNMIENHSAVSVRKHHSKKVVAIGRLSPQKNFELLLKAFSVFQRQFPDWRLEIFGRGRLEQQLKDVAHHLGIAQSVIFAGYVNDVREKILDAGMYVSSSDYEGISNAMTESMQIGLPVVCTDCPVGGAALLIEHRVSGMLVPVGDMTALSSAMVQVASDRELREALSVGARQSVARFAPSRLALVWEAEVFV